MSDEPSFPPSPQDDDAVSAAGGEAVGQTLGRYKLREKVGEGGYGVVYVAEQEEPIRRRVALKVIKLGMDTRSVIARFDAERQALARMDHPNIAKVLDAGATESGRPFFVMELVRGIRITDYCDQHNLSTRQRLELFIPVCHAVQHAHQKGIIHRDLKPSNILVSLHDGVPVPKVIDFGIAKATEGRLTDATVYTQMNQFIGTPAYMSPEQAEMSGLDVDTRADLYSLGVVLYELLTAQTPFDGKELAAAGLEAMRWRLRETEPPRPSTRLASLKEQELTWAAKHRSADAPKLISLLKGDLDWIVMKCLEKDRTRRYETSNGLAQDIERHLNNEPVVARPPTTAYTVQKFVRRNKVMVGAAGLVVAALVLGIAVSTWQAVRATRAEKTAREKTSIAEAERQRAREAAQVADSEKARAENGERKAKESELASRQQAYAADMNLAQQVLAANDLGRAKRLLDGHRPRPGETDLRGWEWRYLWSGCRSDALSVLCRRSNDVYSVAYSADGKTLAMAGLYETFVEIWDVSGRRCIATLQTNAGTVLAFSPRGDLLAANNGQKGINVWQAGTTNLLRQITNSNSQVLKFSPDGTRLANLNDLGEVAIWNVDRWVLVRTIEGPKRSVRADFDALDFSPNGKSLVIGYADGTNRVVDLDKGNTRLSFKAHTEMVTAVAWSPTAPIIASGSGFSGGSIRLWDANSGKQIGELAGHTGWITRGLFFSTNGQWLYSASGDHTIRIWDVPQRRCLAILRGSSDEVFGLALSPDGTTLASGSKDGVVAFWSALPHSKEQQPRLLSGGQGWITTAFAPDSRVLAMPREGIVRLYELSALTEIESIAALGTNVKVVAYSPDGTLIVSGSTNGWLRVWSCAEHRLLQELPGHTGVIFGLGFSSDGTRLLSGDRGGGLTLWDTRTWQRSWAQEAKNTECASLSPDGRLAVASLGKSADQLGWWNTVNGNLLASTTSHRFGVTGAAFSPDGTLLTTVAEDGTWTLWDPSSFRRIFHVKGHINAAFGATFSPDGRRLATGGSTGRDVVKLWDLATYRELVTLHGEGTLFYNIAFSPDGNSLAASGTEGKVHLWRAPSWAEIDAIEKTQPKTP